MILLQTQEKETNSKGRDTSETGEVRKDEDSTRVDGGVIPLSIDHVQGIFFILLMGHLCSLFIFLIEYCCRAAIART